MLGCFCLSPGWEEAEPWHHSVLKPSVAHTGASQGHRSTGFRSQADPNHCLPRRAQ